MSSGPAWWYGFLKAHNVHYIRTFFALGCRESGANPLCLYPSGAPWGDWVNGNGRKFDVGVLQVNVVHLDTLRTIYGPDTDMRVMLDPAKCLDYSIRLSKTGFGDWGLKVAADESSYSFDWSSYPQSWVDSYAADSEAGFKKWWDAYPTYAKATTPAPVITGPSPKPKQPTVSLHAVHYGATNGSVALVQTALNKVMKENLVIDAQFGPKTQAAYDKFRRVVLGWQGPDATGSVGMTSLTELGKRAGFAVIA
jgi:hypothetical protein